MSEVGKFAEWAIVEIMGHRLGAGFVTEHFVAGKGFIRIDVPEVRLSMFNDDRSPAYTKLFGPEAVFSISPCSEEYVRRTVAGRCSEVMEGAKLLTPPNPAPAIGADVFAGTGGEPRVFTSTPNDSVDNLISQIMDGTIADPSADEFRIPAHPIEDAGFTDPLDGGPF